MSGRWRREQIEIELDLFERVLLDILLERSR
jgi:hypothetical protein